MSRVCVATNKTGIGLTTGFIGSHTVTHNYSVYALTAHYCSCNSSLKTAAQHEYSLVAGTVALCLAAN
jgi:hypothetical protein